MKKSSILAIAAIVLPILTVSCNNDSTIGSSIVQNEVTVAIDSAFTVTGYSVPIEKVQSRTIAQLIGRIDADGFGRISSDVVTQFMPATALDTDGITVNDIDSLKLYLYMLKGEYVGDSVVPMGLDIYPLKEMLPSPIFSNFDPEGAYDPKEKLASAIYNVTNTTSDTVMSEGVRIAVDMPLELGKKLYSAYIDNPANFASPTAFAENVFKGIYMKNSYGSGRLMRIATTMMSLYYHKNEVNAAGRDTIIKKQGRYFAVTPEVVTNNNISMEVSEDLQKRVDEGQQVVAAPVGLKLQVNFPAREIIASFRSSGKDVSVLNSVTFSVPAERIENDYRIVPPTYVLMVLASEEESFFANNKLPDNKTSFYATYDSSTGKYDFGQMKAYIQKLLDQSSVSDADCLFTITPVSCSFETQQSSSYYYYGTSSQVMTTMAPYVASPTMARIYLDKAKVKLTYSTQSTIK